MSETEQQAAPKKKPPMIIIMVVLLCLLGAGGFFAKKSLFGSKEPAASQHEAAETGEATGGEEANSDGKGAKSEEIAKDGYIVNLPEKITVNLADSGSPRYAQLQLAVKVAGEKPEGGEHGGGGGEGVDELSAVVSDAIVMVACQFTFEELLSSEGKERFKKATVERVNAVLGEGKLIEVFFPNFAMQ